jgi:streptogramin lyase
MQQFSSLSLFIGFYLLLSSNFVLAQFSGGTGTQADPYQIANFADLQLLSESNQYWGSHFIQTADIDAAVTETINNGAGFSPIGVNTNNSFSGSYNGQNHKIINFFINRPTQGFVGLFGVVNSNFKIQNLFIENGSLVASSNVGALIGNVQGSGLTVENCGSNVNISGAGNFPSSLGGLIGVTNGGLYKNCYATGNVTGYAGVGGLIGGLRGTIEDSYATGNVTGNVNVGGLVGDLWGSSSNSGVTNSYSVGLVTASSNQGGLIGINGWEFGGVPVVNSFYNSTTSGQNDTGKGEPRTTAEMQTQETFTDWDFVSIWSINPNFNNGFPYLQWQLPFSGGTGTQADPYQIANFADLQFLSENNQFWGNHFIQTADIDAAVTETINNGAGFSPIGVNTNNSFSGSYDGQNHKITNFFIDRPTQGFVGLFGIVSSSFKIQNLFIENGSLVASSNVGALIGSVQGSGLTVENCGSNVNISGAGNFPSSLGGLIGVTNGGLYKNCYATGNVTGYAGVGGLIGSLRGTIEDSYATGNVTGNVNVGGLVGDLWGSSSNSGVTNSYSVGLVTASSYQGGLIGRNGWEFGGVPVVNSFYNSTTSGQNDTGKGEPRTIAEMQTQSTFIDWNFSDIWVMSNGCPFSGFPIFQWQETESSPLPEITDAISASIVGAGSVTLSANANVGDVVWYDSEFGGSIVNTGNNFSTFVSESKTYWVVPVHNNCFGNGVAVTATVLPCIEIDESLSVLASETLVCFSYGSTITVENTQEGVNYFLRENETVLQGPVAGNGGNINFIFESVTESKTYNIFAETEFISPIQTTALQFNGNQGDLSQKVSLGTTMWDAAFATGNTLTVEAWIYRTSNGNLQTIASNYQGAYPFLLRIDDNRLTFHINSGLSVQSNSMIPVNSWTHVAGVYEGTSIKVYINGALEGQVTANNAPLIPSGNEMKIGGGLINGTEFFEGKITEVKFWNVARTQQEIQLNMQNRLQGTEEGLVGYYIFDEESGVQTQNLASSGLYPGTWINSPNRVQGLIFNDFEDISICSVQLEQTVTISLPEFPEILVNNPLVFAGDISLSELTITDLDLHWFESSTSEDALDPTTMLVSGTTYYAAQLLSGCENEVRTPITVHKISEATQDFCGEVTVNDLVSTPSSGFSALWFNSATASEALSNNTALATNTYFVEQFSPAEISTLASGFSSPNGIAVEADGKILVTNIGVGGVTRMNADGSNMETVGSGFSIPADVVVQADGKILVSDQNNNTVKRMDADGTNIVTLASEFNNPSGLAVEADGKILVVDRGNNLIKRMNPDGTNIVNVLGAPLIANPFGIAVQPDGKILIANLTSNSIVRINPDGSDPQTLTNELNGPARVAIQSDGKIIVTNFSGSSLVRMDADGSNLETLSDDFSFPVGLAIQANGKILIGDGVNVKLFSEATQSNRVAVEVSVTPLPVVTINSVEPICAGEEITLTATGADTYTWDNDVENGVAFIPTESGDYTVIGTSNGCDSEPVTISVTVNEIPVVEINSVEPICAGEEITLTATGADTYLWDNDVENGVAFIPTESGDYTVIGTTNGCDSESVTISVTVNEIPVVEINSVEPICAGEEITLTATGADTYTWDNEVENGVAFIPTESGDYTVIGTTNGCDSEPETISIVVNEIPVVEINSVEPICAGEEITLTATGADTYLWDNDVENGVAFIPTESGDYTVIGTTNGCDSEPETISIIVNEIPVVEINSVEPICAGEEITLTATGADTYTWDNDIENGVAFIPTESGDYTVIGTTNGCDSEPETISIVVNEIPVVEINSVEPICAGEEITLTATGADTYTWDNDVENGVAFIPTESGDYTVIGTTNGCDSEPATISIVVNEIPVVEINSVEPICAGEEITLTATGADTYTWDNDVENGVAFIPTESGDYTVIGTTNGCDSEPETISIVVNEIPVVEINTVEPICAGEEITLTATGADTYLWDNDVENGIAFIPSESGEYTVIGTTNGCDSEPETISIVVNEIPVVEINSVEPICAGEEITLTATGADTYTWDNDVENGVAFIPTESGDYTVIGTTNGCDSEPETISIIVNEIPVVEINSVEPICAGEEITLTATGADTYTWDNEVENGVAFIPTESGDYTVIGTTNGCDSEPETISIVVNELPEPVISYDTNTETLITGEFESYQWFFEDVLIEDAINQSYQTIVDGVYTVLVSDENCEGLSEEFTLSTVGVATIGSPFSFNLFPNPASEQVTISFNGNLTQQVELHIFDLTGKMVGSKRITQTVQPIKVDNLAEGIFLFRMVSNDFATTQRVVIKK